MIALIVCCCLLFSLPAFGEDFKMPLDDGSIVIGDARFAGAQMIVFESVNQTSSPWDKVSLQFDIDGTCSVLGNEGKHDEPRHWEIPMLISLGWSSDHQERDTEFRSISTFGVCNTRATIKVKLLMATNSKLHIDAVTGERIDLVKQRQDADAAQAEEDRQAAEVQAKKDATEVAHRKRLALEKKNKQAESDAKDARFKAEADAVEAAKQQRVRAACAVIYQNTIDKKVKDLTVREEQQVRACQLVGLYQ